MYRNRGTLRDRNFKANSLRKNCKGLIDLEGSIQINFLYKEVSHSSDIGLAAIKKDGKWGISIKLVRL
ncbi:WG repeat-containing protein [Oceanispirochaeta crateris]|uniref:WG repeat-containing protein n=1 Tax=Oceanispirochaeta crateris TaxID=2518645 RepID=A0A5C1QQW1_9SPIO|nr:WG repeat-containing protein [Oceanispirochaeta crateris]